MLMIILQCCHYDIVISRVAVIKQCKMSAFSVDTDRQTSETMPPLTDDKIYSKSRQSMITLL